MTDITDFGRTVKSREDYHNRTKLPIAYLDPHEICVVCENGMNGSKTGYVHRKTGRKYHQRCGGRFSARFNKPPEEAGLIEAAFEPREKRVRA